MVDKKNNTNKKKNSKHKKERKSKENANLWIAGAHLYTPENKSIREDLQSKNE